MLSTGASVGASGNRVPLGGTLAAGVGLTALGACMLVVAVAGLGATAGAGAVSGVSAGGEASPLARTDIPAAYLVMYRAAALRYGIDWAILAAIGKVECDHGRDRDASCTKEGAENSAGAGGPMQFLAATWSTYGVDGDGDGRISRWDPADAIYSAARYLRASGAPGDDARAIFAYNHAGWYVTEVEHVAAGYRDRPSAATATGVPSSTSETAMEGAPDATRLQAGSATPVRFVASARATLSPSDGHLALIPAEVPAVVQAMLVAGNELQELPYGPGGHPDPRAASEEDCSSTLNYVLYRSGVRPIGEIVNDNPLAQDYVHWGLPGPGRWVTIYATASPTPHVFVVIAGLRLDTSHNGTDVGPNRSQDGPRWRILDHIPTWAQWSVRHPPGL